MNKQFWFILLLTGLGIILLRLPDMGNRLFSFNRDHWPSPGDLAGLLFIITGWAWALGYIIRYRKLLVSRLGSFKTGLMIWLIVTGMVLIASGLILESNGFLYSGILLSAFAYISLMLYVFRK